MKADKYSASEFLKNNGNYLKEELIEIFKNAKENGYKIYLCKKCSADITSNESGICTICEEAIDEDNNDLEIKNEVYDGQDMHKYYEENCEWIELINDLGDDK